MTAEEGVAPGQACVIYDGTDQRARVLGGGTIAPLAARRDAAPAALSPAAA